MVLIKLVSAYVSVRHVTHHVTDEPTIFKIFLNNKNLIYKIKDYNIIKLYVKLNYF